MEASLVPGGIGRSSYSTSRVLRSPLNGRIRSWPLRNRRGGEQVAVEMRPRVILNDPLAVYCALMGLGIAFVATLNARPHLRNGTLVRLLPEWHADIGPIALYFAGHKQLPAKTRVFVNYIVDEFRRQGLAKIFSAN